MLDQILKKNNKKQQQKTKQKNQTKKRDSKLTFILISFCVSKKCYNNQTRMKGHQC